MSYAVGLLRDGGCLGVLQGEKMKITPRILAVAFSISLLCFGLLVLGSSVQARRAMYDQKVKPVISMSEALALANTAIGNTNSRFYCVRAELAKTHDSNGDWLFVFSSTSGDVRYADVGFSKKTWISTTGQRY